MFDDTKLSVNVNMTGKEYIEYRKIKSPLFSKPVSKEMKKAMPYFVFSVLLIIVLSFLISSIFYQPPKPINFEKAIPNILSMSWNDIGKVIAVNYGLIIILCVGVAWVLHGFGFIIIKG